MDDLDLTARPAPTPQRPLLGMTLLLIEDSKFASEAIRMMALRSGARIRRADCLASAHRHLGTYRPDVAIVDLGLPDGSGLSLIEELAAGAHRPSVILATSGQARDTVEGDALICGADGFLAKPVDSLASFQQAIMRHLPKDRWPGSLRAVGAETIHPDLLALSEDLAYAGRILDDPGVTPAYVVNFLQGLARTGHDTELLAKTNGLAAQALSDIRPQLQALIAARLERTRSVV